MLLSYFLIFATFTLADGQFDPAGEMPTSQPDKPDQPSTSLTVELSQPTEEKPIKSNLITTFQAEIGFLLPVAHEIQFGKNGTLLDYVKSGGQDNLFPFMRLSTDLTLFQRHHAVLLYQPLQLDSQVVLKDQLIVEDQVFTSGQALDLRYGFSFWRGSYLYDLIAHDCGNRLAIGASLQIRNASIDFTQPSNGFRRTNRDIGFVPLLKALGKLTVTKQFWLGFEIDGIYAPIKYINGSNTNVVGALLDSSVHFGWLQAQGWNSFLAIRYIGGGAEGDGQNSSFSGDTFTRNWLHFLTLSLGASI